MVDVHLIMAATDGSNLITFQYLANGNQSFHFDVIQCLIWYIGNLLSRFRRETDPSKSFIITYRTRWLGGFNLKNHSKSGLLTKKEKPQGIL